MIAVLSSNFNSTVEWLKTQDEITVVDKIRGIVQAENNRTYLIVLGIGNMVGLTFDSYLKAPDYFTLEDDLKLRIR